VRAGVYARVSLDPRGEGRSVTEQVSECQAWAAREGWDVVDTITETGSASRFARSTQARSGWPALVTLLESGSIDILLTWEASRATRQLREYAELVDLCTKHGVLWGYSGTVHDLSTRDARFRTGLDALLAQDESHRSSDRILRASRARAVAGTPHGKLPYGYRREYDPTTGALLRQVPDETTAPIVRDMIHRVAAGESLYAIAKDLTAQGVPLPRPARGRTNAGDWIPTTIRRIVTSPTYAARRVHRGEVVGDATWPALVDDDTHTRALAAVEAMTERAPRVDRTVKHLLSGIARCGECEGPMVRHMNRGYASYLCKLCWRVARRQPPVDELVVERLMHVLAELHDNPPPATDERATAAEDQAEALRRRLGTFVDQAVDGSLSAASLAKVEARLLPQIQEAEQLSRELRRPAVLSGYDFSDPAALWAGLDITDKRLITAAALDITILRAEGKGRHAFDEEKIVIRPRW
jgi:site-specific DNA recombinase